MYKDLCQQVQQIQDMFNRGFELDEVRNLSSVAGNQACPSWQLINFAALPTNGVKITRKS
ncbi:MAG: hypothetical protein RMX96_33975 [Nostoc sp. ChiSLP02]|nr:hypothetical protein [Nostoc sp. DedSLP05]MDZ8097181.1 hypothetical protein [Nostoc sp. DedSLP01]MDZ8189830.1 hypothetical protein [Nostoc sp. ChiSLP02]